MRHLHTFPLGRYRSHQFYELQVQQRQLQDGLPRLALRGIGEPGRPQSSNGRYCRLVWGVYSSTHCDTDANVHTDIHANAYANIYVDADDHTHVDAHTTPLLRLSAAYREVKERLAMRFLTLAILLAAALLVMASLPLLPAGAQQ